MKHLKTQQQLNEASENLNISESKLTDNDFLFRLFYFTNPDSEIVYRINDLLGEDTGNIQRDWENSPENIKQEIIGIIKSYILTLSY
jgi:hypothetical protein